MDFDYTPEEEDFRREVRDFLDMHLPEDSSSESYQKWNQALFEKKWVGFSWPVEVGGGGGSLMEQFILKEEMSARRAPPLGTDFMLMSCRKVAGSSVSACRNSKISPDACFAPSFIWRARPRPVQMVRIPASARPSRVPS